MRLPPMLRLISVLLSTILVFSVLAPVVSASDKHGNDGKDKSEQGKGKGSARSESDRSGRDDEQSKGRSQDDEDQFEDEIGDNPGNSAGPFSMGLRATGYGTETLVALTIASSDPGVTAPSTIDKLYLYTRQVDGERKLRVKLEDVPLVAGAIPGTVVASVTVAGLAHSTMLYGMALLDGQGPRDRERTYVVRGSGPVLNPPDLAIQNVHLVGEAVEGILTKVSVLVGEVGGDSGTVAEVRLLSDVASVAPDTASVEVGPNGAVQVVLGMLLPAGPHTLTVRIQGANPPESNTGNNEDNLPIVVAPEGEVGPAENVPMIARTWYYSFESYRWVVEDAQGNEITTLVGPRDWGEHSGLYGTQAGESLGNGPWNVTVRTRTETGLESEHVWTRDNPGL